MASDSSFKLLVTVDRDCRKVFAVDRGGSACDVVAEIEQRLDSPLEISLSADARAWNRGLKTIRQTKTGFVLCDIFGIYDLDSELKIRGYLSIPQFTDIHSAFPCGDRLLTSNTGVDQTVWVDWEGRIADSIDLHRWFPATPWMAQDLAAMKGRWKGDLRRMPLDWARESCHVNWAEETPLGTMISCFIQGEILFFRDGKPVRRVRARAKCHAPRYLAETQTILYSASEENRIVEIDLNGNEIWTMEGFQFPKFADLLSDGNLIVADTGNRRIVEADRASRRVLWQCAVPGTPYMVEPWLGK